MPHTGASVILDALEQYGVTRIFGNPGTTELPLMRLIGRRDLDYVLTLHEGIAVGMSAGYAKTKQIHAQEDPDINPVGFSNLHVAPGLANGLANIFNSGLVGTGAPLVITAGDHSTDHQYREPNLGADLVQMTNQFTKWSAEVKNVDALPTMLRRAFRVALTPPTGPVFLSLPFDILTQETNKTPERLGAVSKAGAGNRGSIDRAVEYLEDADEPVLLVGDLVARSGPGSVSAAARLSEVAGMRVYGEIKSSEIDFPPDHENWFGLLPREDRQIAECLNTDTIVFAGIISNSPTNPQKQEYVPDKTTTIHLSDYDWEIGKNQIADIGITGDPEIVLNQISEGLEERISDDERRQRLDSIEQYKEQNRQTKSTREGKAPDASGISNKQLAKEMRAAVPDARVIAEAATSTRALRKYWNFEPGQFLGNRGGGLGYGLPAAIGSAMAEQELTEPRSVIGFIGDGSYLYYPHSIYTAVRYNVDITIIIPDNRSYRVLKNNTVRNFGGAESDYEFTGMDFDPPIDIPANAMSHGASAVEIESPDDIKNAVENGVSESGPTVIDVIIND